MKKALKIFLIITILISAVLLSAVAAYFVVTSDVKLNPEKLIDYEKCISIYDSEGEKIENTSYFTKCKSVNLKNLNEHTVNAFIASEDRDFYSHNGLNYKRMLKAAYKNVTSLSFKEGASTISQQLIKNTHLTNRKKISRKLKEIRLTKQLEKKYSKDEILEMYLNTIYFGHNCYGLQSAASFYFGKPAENLNLEESAAIVGIISSPNNYSPFKNREKCLTRRNVVLKCMLDCNFIDANTYKVATAAPLNLAEISDKSNNVSYVNAVLDELDTLGIDPYGANREIRVNTFLNRDIQSKIESIKTEHDNAIFVRDCNGGVTAFTSSIGSAKRQIGSTAKPILVYAPAIEEKRVHLLTKIKDEKIDYNGYSPENSDKKYHGEVSVLDSIKYSYNVPAVKVLNSLDMKSVESYADKMGITLDDEDKNLSLALGAMKQGLSLKELTDSYSVFQNGGEFIRSRFIKEICDGNSKVIYKINNNKEKVFSEGVCSIMNRALTQTVKSGTAKRLKDIGIDVACKTGTCGNAQGNTDAYAIAYTAEHCIGVWQGDKNNNRLNITGSNQCCSNAAEILNFIYKSKSCPQLEKDRGTETVYIDREEYEGNGKILLCDDSCPTLNKLAFCCTEENIPKSKSTRFTCPEIQKPQLFVNNNRICISLCQTKYYTYVVKRYNSVNSDIIYSGGWVNKIYDEPTEGSYSYTVIPQFYDGINIYSGKEIFIDRVIVNKNPTEQKSPDIVFKDWYNQ